MQSKPGCDALDGPADALGDELIQEANRKDHDYGASTRHSRGQGARFPDPT
jgi:hypothetical protein